MQNLDAKLEIERALLTVILWLFYLGHSFDYSISLFLFIYFSLVIYGHYKYTFTHLGSAACTSIFWQNGGGLRAHLSQYQMNCKKGLSYFIRNIKKPRLSSNFYSSFFQMCINNLFGQRVLKTPKVYSRTSPLMLTIFFAPQGLFTLQMNMLFFLQNMKHIFTRFFLQF